MHNNFIGEAIFLGDFFQQLLNVFFKLGKFWSSCLFFNTVADCIFERLLLWFLTADNV